MYKTYHLFEILSNRFVTLSCTEQSGYSFSLSRFTKLLKRLNNSLDIKKSVIRGQGL